MKNLLLIVAFASIATLGMAQSKTDIQAVIQMSIDIDVLQPYLHPELDDRKPLIIQDDGVIPSNLGLVKFGEPVKFLQKNDLFFLNKDAYLIFDQFEMNAATATVLFLYPVEGIKVRLTFEKADGEWVIATKKLSEE